MPGSQQPQVRKARCTRALNNPLPPSRRTVAAPHTRIRNRDAVRQATDRRLDRDRAVVAQGPPGVVGYLPHVAVGIGERSRGTAPLRPSRGTHDGATRLLRLAQRGGDLFGRSDVVGQFDAWRTVAAECGPKTEDHAARLKEADLVIWLLRPAPAESLVERTGSGQVSDTERDQADPLIHEESMTDRGDSGARSAIRCRSVCRRSGRWCVERARTLRSMGSRSDERLEELRRVLVQGPTPVTVLVVDPDPAWPAQYEVYAADLRVALGDRLRLVEHIGSTAVADLPAKPVIDIVAGIDDPDDEAAYLPDLIAAGWDLRVREPGHRCLRAEPSRSARRFADTHVVAANLHCYQPGSPEIDRYLKLRDLLRTDPSARSRYASLKRSLAGREWPDMNLYADAKGPLIRELLGDNSGEG
jgi:GrpB-like predicted nucleotidyltransferase (UPF0157 family)